MLTQDDVPTPTISTGQALIKVGYCGVNHIDIWSRTGALDVQLPHIPGSEIAGTVVTVNGRSDLQPNDAIVVAPWMFCGQCRWCQSGNETLCESGGIIGRSSDGGYAEYVAVPSANLVSLPAALTTRDGAALGLAALTAWHMLAQRAGLRRGETLLVIGASSGVGSYGVQLGKYLGATVIATTTRKEKIDWLQTAGADHVLVAEAGKFSAAVRQIAPHGVDVVFEHVGQATLPESLATLAPNGRVVICGVSGGPTATFDLRPFYSQQHALLGARGGSRAELQELLQLAAAGKIRPLIDQVLPLSEARRAQTLLENGEQRGKILLSLQS